MLVPPLITCGQLPVQAYGEADVMFIQYRNISLPCQSTNSPAFIQSPKNPERCRGGDNDRSVIEPLGGGGGGACLWSGRSLCPGQDLTF